MIDAFLYENNANPSLTNPARFPTLRPGSQRL
jgi:hypothetical protein